jgi:dienelactone hydrolase
LGSATRRATLGAVLSVLAAGLVISVVGPARSAPPPSLVAPASPPFETYRTTDRLGREITYYLAPPAKRAPLLLVIQGSGCDLLFDRGPKGSRLNLAEFILPLTQGRFTVLVVEKPYSGAVGGVTGTATHCSRAFNEEFTAERWAGALEAAVRDARRRPFTDPGRMLVLGHSEGARMAAMLAGRDGRITDVAMFGGGGVTPFFDTLASAYQRGDTAAERLAHMQASDEMLRAIAAKPDSVDDFAWGHPYRRWSSFFRTSPTDDLRRSKARVYVANGTADESVPFLSSQILAATLLTDGRDVTVRRIPDADHSLRTDGAKGSAETAGEYARALDWFWARPQR